MPTTLFRTEVLEARRQAWLGAVALDQPPAMRWLVLLASLACVGIGIGLARGEYTRRTAVAGVLVPDRGIATVIAPVGGIVATLAVGEGERVLADTALATIAIPDVTSGGATGVLVAQSIADRTLALAATQAAQRRRLDLETASLHDQQGLARAELADLDAELATRRQQQALAEATLARYRRLHAQRFVTDLQLQQQETAALDQRAAAQALQRQAAALRRQLAQLAQALANVPEQRAQLTADADRDRALLRQEEAHARARRDATVPAPLAGRVAAVLVQPGQSVVAGQPLLTLLPAATRLEAHLQVPGHALASISPGHRVLLRYAALPYQNHGQHGGRVVRISGTALPATDAGAEPLFRLVVVPDRQRVGAFALQPGWRLDAQLPGETRPLWRWVLAPLESLRASATFAENASTRVTTSPRPVVGIHESDAANSPRVSRSSSSRAACDAGATTRQPGITEADASRVVGDRPMAADPGTRGVVQSPADGGRPPGECDA